MNAQNVSMHSNNSGRSALFARALGVSVLISLASCQTTDQGGSFNPISGGGTPGQKSYSIFYDQGDHLAELTKAARWRKAADLYADHRVFFSENIDNARIVTNLLIVAKNIDAELGRDADRMRRSVEALEWPQSAKHWSTIKAVLSEAETIRGTYQSTAIFQISGFRSSHSEALKSTLNAKTRRIADDAENALLNYGTMSGPLFFQSYPVTVDADAVLAGAMPVLINRLSGQTVEQLSEFQKQYAGSLTPDQRARIADLAFTQIVAREAGGGRPGLEDVLTAYEKAKSLGLEPKELDSPAIRFVEVTSRTLLKEGQIEFPAAVEIDLPIRFEKADLDAALTAATSDSLDILIVYDVAVARTFRRVASREKIPSQYKSGVRHDPNPARATAQYAVQQAQMNLQSVEIRSATGCIGCGIIPALIHAGIMGSQKATARKQLAATMQNLAQTPMTLEKPVYSDYSYNRTYVDSGKVMGDVPISVEIRGAGVAG